MDELEAEPFLYEDPATATSVSDFVTKSRARRDILARYSGIGCYSIVADLVHAVALKNSQFVDEEGFVDLLKELLTYERIPPGFEAADTAFRHGLLLGMFKVAWWHDRKKPFFPADGIFTWEFPNLVVAAITTDSWLYQLEVYDIAPPHDWDQRIERSFKSWAQTYSSSGDANLGQIDPKTKLILKLLRRKQVVHIINNAVALSPDPNKKSLRYYCHTAIEELSYGLISTLQDSPPHDPTQLAEVLVRGVEPNVMSDEEYATYREQGVGTNTTTDS